MASWNALPLEIAYQILGWTAFVSWSVSFYPQVILNYCRKSVVGLNFDFVVLNLTKHSTYLIYNATLFFSKAVQKQYFEKYGFDQMIPVAANDVAFSIHAVLLTAFTLYQICIYEKGGQKVSRISFAIVAAAWLAAAICCFIALSTHSWLWLVSIFNSIQVSMTLIKYTPQAVMNFRRKSTDGFSIGNIILDLGGGLANYAQMAMQSIDQHTWVNFYGNIGKTLLSLISVAFDLLFIIQHYVLYPARKFTSGLASGKKLSLTPTILLIILEQLGTCPPVQSFRQVSLDEPVSDFSISLRVSNIPSSEKLVQLL